MIRYILALLLVNTSYRSLGNPIPTVSVSLANSMTTLSEHCGNVFLSNQIKSQLPYCSDLTSPRGEKQLQCLMFYDMNMQLCAAAAASKLTMSESDFANKIKEEQDVNTLCLTTIDWTFSNLTEFPRYKPAADKVYKRTVSCSKICGVEDLMSDDTNYFCKFYKWGTDTLKQTPATMTQQNAQLPPETTNIENKEKSVANSDLQDVQIVLTNSTVDKSKTPTSNIPLKSDVSITLDTNKPEISSLTANHKSQSVDPGSISNVAAPPQLEGNADTNANNNEDTGAMPENNYPDVQVSKSPETIPAQTVLGGVSQDKAIEDAQNKPEPMPKTEDKDIQHLNTVLEKQPTEMKPPKAKAQNDVDDYQGPDSEEGKDTDDTDLQGGDDDPNIGDIAEDLKPPAKIAEAVGSSLAGEKENYYANAVPEAFSEDDDHFFPFFLSAVILVVLLYVLYHNKNKVGKVFFGLVLEGRQAGRRRSSRGHAYRRLDTLEQAMSAGSTAPPSKIIY